METFPPHLAEELYSSAAISIARIGGDHGIVGDGVADEEGRFIEHSASEVDVCRVGISSDEGGASDDVWLGNCVEQVAGVCDVCGFAVEIDQTV